MEEAIPRLSPTGLTRTEKFWVSSGGEIIPLKGLWHYQWALLHREEHRVDLGGNSKEQPIRLRMLASGWWRINFERKTCVLTIEGDVVGVNEDVRDSLVKFLQVNAGMLNRVGVNVLNGEACADTNLIDAAMEDSTRAGSAVKNIFEAWIRS